MNKPMLAYLKIKGSPHEVGLALGRFGADAVHRYLKHSQSWATVMQWLGSNASSTMSQMVREQTPRYWQELQGLAQGLELPLEQVFLWNCRGDLWSMAPDGCTTVQLPGRDYPAFSHNEDGDPNFAGQCGMAEVQVDGQVRFSSFVYPGSWPGHTLAVNDSGLAMTVNNLRTLNAGVGLPRMVLTRAMLDLDTPAAAVRYLQGCSRAGGFHLTLGKAGHKELLSVEFTSSACSVLVIDRPAIHANHMVHDKLAHEPQIITESSACRQQRGNEMLAAASAGASGVDALGILFDQENAVFPIFRAAADDADHENTLATAHMQVHQDSVTWEIHSGQGRVPVFLMKNGGQS